MALSVAVKKRLENSGKSFALDAVFSSSEDVVVLYGPSGSGKSLTLKAIAGLLTPDSGRVEVDGVPLFDSAEGVNISPSERNIGFVFQDYALFPNLNVEENIAFPLRRGIFARFDTRALQEAAPLVEAFGLKDLRTRRMGELSGGQRQRVALARALAAKPRLMLLDEPFSALDRDLRNSMRDLFKEVQREFKVPAILVTHDMEDVEALADEVVLLKDGSVQRTWGYRALCRKRKVANFVSIHGPLERMRKEAS